MMDSEEGYFDPEDLMTRFKFSVPESYWNMFRELLCRILESNAITVTRSGNGNLDVSCWLTKDEHRFLAYHINMHSMDDEAVMEETVRIFSDGLDDELARLSSDKEADDGETVPDGEGVRGQVRPSEIDGARVGEERGPEREA